VRVRRFYYEDAEKPWEPDGILKKQVPPFDYAQGLRLAVLSPPWRASAPDDRLVHGPRALDLGMGYGRNAIWLADQGYEVEGWEVERRYVAEARRSQKAA
jgi:2-polyprenyl-3-methyl-5-hydroxy-6-metoxy-1,4-benzoquinol methylase